MSANTFTHDGRQYRIGFQHDKPRDWSAHKDHPIIFAGDGVLCCTKCHCTLSGIGPVATRNLKAAGREADRELDQLANGMNATVLLMLQKRAKAVRRLMARDLARDVTCTIYVRVGEEWKATSMVGHSRLNTDAGDQYNREQGRIAALRNALPQPEPKPDASLIQATAEWQARRLPYRVLVSAAMDAYLNRARKAKDRTGKAGGK